MSRQRLFRATFLCVALMMVFSLLVACGGGDDDDDNGGGGSSNGDIPVPSGADRLAEEDISAEDLDAPDADISDAKAVAYKITGSSVDDVAEFYENDVADDGWTVDEHVALGELMLTVFHKDDDLVIATAMTGAAAREQGGADMGDLTVDLDELEDDDILLVAATFTCNEDSMDACIEALDLGL